MFTGIVAGVGKVISLHPERLLVDAGQILKGVEKGASIAVNGVCLTVTNFSATSFEVGISEETLRCSNTGLLKPGDAVNLERALGFGGELGGHLVQGHVDGRGKIIHLTPESGSTIFRFEAPPEIMRYQVQKGFIAVEGISLTVAALGPGYFEVAVIDYTKKTTNLNSHKIGDTVNLEIDIMAKYAEKFIQNRNQSLSMDILRANGF
jgi:riboflavin synthase